MSAQYDALRRAVEDESTVIDGAIKLLDELAASADDPQKLQQLAQEIGNKKEALAQALIRNTRAASIEASAARPAPGSVPGMTTGNNEGGQKPVTEQPTTTDQPATSNPEPMDMGGNFPPR